VSRFVLAREANNALLTDLHRVLVAARSTLTNSKLSEFARHTLQVTRFETGLGSAEAEVCIFVKRRLFMWQKRPIHMAKEA
jgi:hypothetical protein